MKWNKKEVEHMVTAVSQAAASMGVLPGRLARPFVLVGGPRSGSTWLQTLINSHPNVVCMHELFRDNSGPSVFLHNYLGHRRRLLRMRNENLEAFLQAIYCMKQPRWIWAVGFKALYTQPRAARRVEAWSALSKIKGLKGVWISRNPVRRVVSFIIARSNGAWIGKRTSEPIYLDTEYVLRRLAFEERVQQETLALMQNVSIFPVEYEKLKTNPSVELENIQQFLEIPVHPLHTSLRRQNPFPLRRLVANYDDLEQTLHGTKWHDMLLHADNE